MSEREQEIKVSLNADKMLRLALDNNKLKIRIRELEEENKNLRDLLLALQKKLYPLNK